MRVTHEFVHHATCPVDGAFDRYEITVEVERLLKVESIIEAIGRLPKTLFQEQMTQTLAHELGAKVTSIGFHSGIKTTCRA